MGYLALLVGAVVFFWLIPYAVTHLEEAADPYQNRCHPEEGMSPRRTARPGYVGEVLPIRLTNNGSFVNRCELTNVLYEINWEVSTLPGTFGPQRKEGAKPLPKLIVLYIHGWKHSASEKDSDLMNFKKKIQDLHREYVDTKQVLGIYVGWNATSKIPLLNCRPFNNLTFWAKQTIADRIAQSGVITKVLSAISSVLSEGVHSSANQFIVIGHSFGARMLFSSTSQPLSSDTQRAHPGVHGGVYSVIQGLANAVILLNPALEAARYTSIDAITRIEEQFSNNQLPLLLSISSSGDWATKTAFPLGQMLRSYSSRPERTTLGNYSQYKTHTLRIAKLPASEVSELGNDLSEHFTANGLSLTRDGAKFYGEKNEGVSQRDTMSLERKIVQPRNPFLIAQTNSEIIKNHNDIWNFLFSEWLFAYVGELGQKRRPRLLDERPDAY